MPVPLFVTSANTGAAATAQANPVSWSTSADGNWQTNGNWDGGNSPGNGDRAVIASGTVNIDAGLSNPTTYLDRLSFGRGHTGDIGTADSALIVDAVEVHIRKRSGIVNLSGEYQSVYIHSTGPDAGTSRAVKFFTGCRILNLFIFSTNGRVFIDRAATVNNVHLMPAQGAICRLEMGATIVHNELSGGGAFIKSTSANVGSIRAHTNTFIDSATGADILTANGVMEYVCTAGGFDGSDSGDDVILTNGAVLEYQGSGTIDTVKLYRNGTLTIRNNESATVTVNDVEMYRTSAFDARSGANNVTLTNDIDYYGGLILLEDGSTMSPVAL
jgi:hypothetical protein